MSAIVLFRGRGLISALVRWQTRGDYSHAALLMDDGKLVESWQGVGVRIKSHPDLSDAAIFDVPSMTQAQWDKAMFFARCQVGKGYDYWAIIRFITRERMPDNDRWFCSELVFAALEHAGVKLLARVETWAVSPSGLELSPLMVERSWATVAVPRRVGYLRKLLRKTRCAVLGHMIRWSPDSADDYCQDCGKKL